MESISQLPPASSADSYFLVYLDGQGQIDIANQTQQFKVEVNSEVRFKLPSGTKVSSQAKLLVNLPLASQSGGVTYTVTQPKIPTNIDPEEGNGFKIIQYRGSQMEQEYLSKIEPYLPKEAINLEFRVHFPHAGSFFFQIEYFDSDINEINYTQPQIINVEPVLILRNERVRCKQLSMMTVLSRCLGPLSRWESVLANVSQLGYNAVHFTPMQQYGSSYSHYSLADQTFIDDYYFPNETSLTREERLHALKQQAEHLREEYGLLGIVDIVLNHTASNSPWLLEHPEAAYNTEDCPHLFPAWLFDKALSDFSDEYARRQNVPECPNAPFINNEQDLQNTLIAIKRKVIQRLNLHEFFLFNINDVVDQLKNELKQVQVDQHFQTKYLQWQKKDHYFLLQDKFIKNLGNGPQRHSVTLDFPNSAAFFYLANNKDHDRALNEVRELLKKHNAEWTTKVAGFMDEALKCIEGTVRYFKIEQRQNKITAENKILSRYFSELNNDKKSCVAHNGWIMNADPMEDFGMKGWHYLRRTINIWSDSVKLRYGMCPDDSPFLWNHMSQYVADMASTFDGFRLDNAHSTPIHVCFYLLQVARSHKPNLYVMAELFTSSAVADAFFVKSLNINGLIREIQNTYNSSHLGGYFHQLTCREAVVGQLDENFEDVLSKKFKILKPVKPNEVIYDCTHDNPAPLAKFSTAKIALSHMGLVSMADTAIATTWGYDQLIPSQLNVVTETKLYETPNQSNLFEIDKSDPNKRRQKAEKIVSPEWTPEEKKQEPTEFENEFVFYHDSAQKVELAGCFSNWKPIFNLTKEGHNKWIIKLKLPIIKGQDKYEFKFVVNGKDWQLNKNLPQVSDGRGNVNNALFMPGAASQTQSSFALTQNGKQFTLPDIRYARLQLNEIHEECTQNDAEIHMIHPTENIIVIIRQFPLDYEKEYDGYVSITRQEYYTDSKDPNYYITIQLPALIEKVVFAGFLEIPQNAYSDFFNDKQQVRGAQAQFRCFKDLNSFCEIKRIQDQDVLSFFKMPPSFTCVLRIRHPQHMKDAVWKLNEMKRISSDQLGRELFAQASLAAFNHLLFRCDQEERDISNNKRGTYGLEKYGLFEYAGITTYIHLLRQLKLSQEMGHELFNNMREGNWLIDYSVERLQFMPEELGKVTRFLQENFGYVKALDSKFKPKYASIVFEKLYEAARNELMNRRITEPFMQENDDFFMIRLALACIQMWGKVPSAFYGPFQDTMAAGLPHFTTGYTRCWGRDTFIALRGLQLALGFEEEAKQTILYFASTMRHGLIPNLHDRCNNTRFNARDATWFFFQAVKDYVSLCKKSNGLDILKERVALHFRDNDQRVHWEKINRGEPPRTITLAELLQEMLQVQIKFKWLKLLQAHAHGISFREWNAGSAIDAHMKPEGFNVNIRLDQETGFLFGGNQFNCGTWMDKMGSSEKTGNRGLPATPRDGAPVELVGLLYSSLRLMQDLSEKGEIQFEGVQLKSGEKWSYKEWADRILSKFEQHFWIPDQEKDDSKYVIEKKHVKRRGFYKDVVGPSDARTAYQLRPNLCVAMACAPDLFEPKLAQICLQNVGNILMESNCMGMKTLDPADPSYKGDYINSDDSHGWNYHQGPEWLWPVGFFLKARLIFCGYSSLDKNLARQDIMRYLVPYQKYIISDPWEGLPELTNSHGKECKDSCTTQAWSIATIIDALRDLYYF